MRQLLILACSARKKPSGANIPAWDLYDGVAFRVVKSVQRQGQLSERVDVQILSAEHGLISTVYGIASYERKMTPSRAMELQSQVVGSLKEKLSSGDYQEVFIFAGNIYLEAMQPFVSWCPTPIRLTVAHGRIGQKLRQLKAWILEKNCKCMAESTLAIQGPPSRYSSANALGSGL